MRRVAPRSPDLDLRHLQRRAALHRLPAEIDIVDADDLASVHVDDLAIQQVLPQQQRVLMRVSRLQLGTWGHHQATGLGQTQRLHVNVLAASRTLHNQRQDASRLGSCAHRHVRDAPPHLPGGIHYRRAFQQRQAALLAVVCMHRRGLRGRV